MSALERELRELFRERLARQVPLAEFTSFRIGGPADLFVEVEDDRELGHALASAWRHRIPAFCLGAGTNLLVSDRGIRGLVVKLGSGFDRIEIDGLKVTAGAAGDFGALVTRVVEAGLAGLEFGEGIPGSVGGALVMNAGAFGGEMSRVVSQVRGALPDGRQAILDEEGIGFGYRRSLLPEGFIITSVEFVLEPGDRNTLESRVRELKAKRASRQPRGLPNAGSIFKNPPGSFAGRLLESCGLKGERIGRAAFSEHHANFIVNLGGARAAEVRALIQLARDKVCIRTGVSLEPEVRMVGEWEHVAECE